MVGKTVSFLAGHKFTVYALFVFITLFTIIITLIPTGDIENETLHRFDKLGHFVLFFGWTFMLGFSLIIHKQKIAPLLWIFLAGTFFGISIEVVQELMPYDRYASLMDVVANMAGSLAAILLLWGIQTKYQMYLQPALSKK